MEVALQLFLSQSLSLYVLLYRRDRYSRPSGVSSPADSPILCLHPSAHPSPQGVEPPSPTTYLLPTPLRTLPTIPYRRDSA